MATDSIVASKAASFGFTVLAVAVAACGRTEATPALALRASPSPSASVPVATGPTALPPLPAPASSAAASPYANFCPPGFGDCNGLEADGCETSLASLEHCGACGAACPVVLGATMACVVGAGGAECTAQCAATETRCGPACVDTRNDRQHCGRCGHACSGALTCAGGYCESSYLPTVFGKPDLLATDGQTLFVADSTSVTLSEVGTDGTVLAEWPAGMVRAIVPVNRVLYWTNGVGQLRRKDLSGVPVPEEILLDFAGEPSEILLADDALFWFGTQKPVTRLHRWDLSTNTHATLREFPSPPTPLGFAAGQILAAYLTDIYAIDPQGPQTQRIATGPFYNTRGCVRGDTVYFIGPQATVRPVYAVPTVGSPGALKPLFPIAQSSVADRLLCDASGPFVAVSDGQKSEIVHFPLPAGPLVRVADGRAAHVGPIVRVGDALYWTLPDQGAIARVDL